MSKRRSTALSPPEMFLLDAWGHSLRAAFRATPYLVGSVERGEEWRDVDVRMILDDDEYETLLGTRSPERMTAFNVAISYWGQRATGLPIDFQFQARAHATARYGDEPRNPLGSRTGLSFLDHEPPPPPPPAAGPVNFRERLAAQMVDPTDCGYCEGTGWVFLDKSYDGYPDGRPPYVEPDDTNGGYEACGRCNSDHEVEFGSGEKVKPWRRWTDDQVTEILAALAG